MQVAIVNACCILHNFIRQNAGHVCNDELHNEGTPIKANAHYSSDDDDDENIVQATYVVPSISMRANLVSEGDKWRNFINNLASAK